MTIKCLLFSPSYEGKDAWKGLQYTTNDSEKLKQLLIEELGVQINDIFCLDGTLSSDVATTYNLTADIHNMLECANSTINSLEEGDTFIFFFSGHGIEENGIKLIPQFCLRSNLERTAFDLEKDLLDPLRESKKKVKTLFIVDSCRELIREKGTSSQNSLIVDLLTKNNIIGLLACSKGECSREIEEFQQGVFTHFLIESMYELINNDEFDDIRKLFKVVLKKVKEFTKNEQHPELICKDQYEDPLAEFKTVRRTNSQKIVSLLEQHTDGMTDKEIQKELKMDGNSERPSRLKLVKNNVIIELGDRNGEKVWALKVYHKDKTSNPSLADYL